MLFLPTNPGQVPHAAAGQVVGEEVVEIEVPVPAPAVGNLQQQGKELNAYRLEVDKALQEHQLDKQLGHQLEDLLDRVLKTLPSLQGLMQWPPRPTAAEPAEETPADTAAMEQDATGEREESADAEKNADGTDDVFLQMDLPPTGATDLLLLNWQEGETPLGFEENADGAVR